MSNSHFIKQLFKIEDENLEISELLIEEEKQGVRAHILPATLTYTPKACECCGVLNNNGQIIKHGSKTTDVQLLPVMNQATFLRLKRQRFLCTDKECGQTFSAHTSLVLDNHYIAKNVSYSIALALREKSSMTDIAKRHFVSTKTVERVLKNFSPDAKPNFSHLPKVLMVDEFKGMSGSEGAMCFICADGEIGKIVDILDDRRLFNLVRYFNQYTRDARLRVQYLVMDMNASYQELIKTVFPRAQIIIDRFHIVQQLTRAMNQVRIKSMNRLTQSKNEEAKNYRKLKKYWRLVLKKNKYLNYTAYKQWPLFQQKYVCETDVLDKLLSIDPELEATYSVYQQLMYHFDKRDSQSFFEVIRHVPSGLPKEFKKKVTYLIKHEKGITLAFQKPYSNGRIEAKNNIIKVMKRIAFGFRNFSNLKLRVFIQQNIIELN